MVPFADVITLCGDVTRRMPPFIIVLAAVAVVTVQGQEACNFGSGPGCKFPCRCAGGAPCDELTGQCPDDRCLTNLPEDFPSGAPEAGWEGPGCQTGNAAYNKPAWQYRQYMDWSADRAVDGVVDRRHCSHPVGPGLAWWTVDLGALYTVYRVTVANTDRFLGSWDYMKNLRVFVSNSSLPKPEIISEAVVLNSVEDIQSYGDFINCGDFPGQVGPREEAKVTCGQPLVGRYVLVWKYGAEDEPRGSITLCEVTVTGHKYAACDGCVTDCNPVYGCIADCPAGKNQTTFCVQDCADGSYGPNCRDTCSVNCRSSCSRVDGTCADGCLEWWIGATCDRQIGPIKAIDLSLTISATTRDTVTLRWSRLSGVAQGLESHYGYVIMLLGPTNQWEDAAWVNYTQANLVQFTLGGLRNNTLYLVWLEAYRQSRPLVERVNVSSAVSFMTKGTAADPDGKDSLFEDRWELAIVFALGVLLALAVVVIVILVVRRRRSQSRARDETASKEGADRRTGPSVTMATAAATVVTPTVDSPADSPVPPAERPVGQYEAMGHVTSGPNIYDAIMAPTPTYEAVGEDRSNI